jgi:methylated-DNA-[protein]-cysteine S-methyltransferase
MGRQINDSETDKIVKVHFDSPIGAIAAQAIQLGILAVSFTESELENNYSESFHTHSDNLGINHLKKLYIQLNEYFDGRRKSFDLSMHPAGTVFQQKVWDELQNIPYGETRSYQQQTNKMGDPKAIRAVASANGKNPIAIIIPCHRIIGSNGSLTGYAGGLWRKKWLLEHEAKHSGRSYQSKLGL